MEDSDIYTKDNKEIMIHGFGDVAQMVRACGSYPQCPGFNSLHRHHVIDIVENIDDLSPFLYKGGAFFMHSDTPKIKSPAYLFRNPHSYCSLFCTCAARSTARPNSARRLSPGLSDHTT
jgi:hypothetical protein